MQVGVTNATVRHPNDDLSRSRRLELDVVDNGKVAARTLEQDGTHLRNLPLSPVVLAHKRAALPIVGP